MKPRKYPPLPIEPVPDPYEYMDSAPGQLQLGYIQQMNSQRSRRKPFLGFYRHQTKKKPRG